jgi:hypothetical protein
MVTTASLGNSKEHIIYIAVKVITALMSVFRYRRTDRQLILHGCLQLETVLKGKTAAASVTIWLATQFT